MPTGDTPKEEIYAKRSGPRELYDVKCSKCGAQTVVPFKPNPNWKSYCRDCYNERKAKGQPVPPLGPLGGDDPTSVTTEEWKDYLAELETHKAAAAKAGNLSAVRELKEEIEMVGRYMVKRGAYW